MNQLREMARAYREMLTELLAVLSTMPRALVFVLGLITGEVLSLLGQVIHELNHP